MNPGWVPITSSGMRAAPQVDRWIVGTATMAVPMDDEVYQDLVRRIRAGDQRAAEEVVRRYEPDVRLVIRGWLRLRNHRLRRVFDSMDVCQSVMTSFFIRAAVGEFDLGEPHQLLPLLVGIARNKLAEQVRFHQQKRRDVRRVQAHPLEDRVVDAAGETASQVVANRELLEQFRARLTDEERQVAMLRVQGLDWAAVAESLGGTAEARRKQLSRAIGWVEHELGLDSFAG
jgi:RNA polymerase sigma-70 factor (ECF subfamily)